LSREGPARYPLGMIPDRLMAVVFPARDQSLARVAAGLSEPESGRPADILRPAGPFVEAARAGRIATLEDLFAP